MNRLVSRLQKAVKRFLAAAALVLAVIAVIVLVRTVRFASRQITVPPIPKQTFDENLAAERLSKAVGFRTISYHDPTRVDAEAFFGLHEYLEQTFPKVHAALRKETVGDYSLLFTWEGTDPARKPILLMSHLDVVPVEPGTEPSWTHPAFAGRIADGAIYGRGTLDVKSGVMGILEAVELLLTQGFKPAATVYLAFGHDEEVGGKRGNAQIARMLKERGVRFEYVLDEGGAIAQGLLVGVSAPVALVGVAEKEYLSVELVVEHQGGHSAAPPPQTAVGVLSAAISRLEAKPFPARLDGPTGLMLDYLGPEMSFTMRIFVANRWLFGWVIKRKFSATATGNAAIRTTAAATMIQAGIRENVIPRNASAVVNFRILPGESVSTVLQQVRRVINDPRVRIQQLDTTGACAPSPVSDVGSPAFATLERTIREVFPDVLVAPCLAIGTTDSRHYAALAENVFRFIPSRIKKSDVQRIHGTNERISVENYAEIIQFFVALIQNSAA